MPTQYKHTVELELNGEVTVSRCVYHNQLEHAIKNLKIIAKRSKDQWAIFVTRKSKVNSLIKNIKDDTE